MKCREVMHRFIHSLLLIWRGELPEDSLAGARMNHTECCAYFPRCKVGARKGHIVALHNDERVVVVHFDDGDYGVRDSREVEHLWDAEVKA